MPLGLREAIQEYSVSPKNITQWLQKRNKLRPNQRINQLQ